MGELSDARTVIEAWAAANEVECEAASEGELVLLLPGEHKRSTAVSLRLGATTLSAQAFVIRAPEENQDAVHRWLLRRNARLGTPAFMIDGHGDVYLTARLSAAAVNAETVDTLMSGFALAADESFDELLALGFLSGIRREWEWRISRGESTANLAAFEPLLRRPPREDGE